MPNPNKPNQHSFCITDEAEAKATAAKQITEHAAYLAETGISYLLTYMDNDQGVLLSSVCLSEVPTVLSTLFLGLANQAAREDAERGIEKGEELTPQEQVTSTLVSLLAHYSDSMDAAGKQELRRALAELNHYISHADEHTRSHEHVHNKASIDA